jgi:L-alanine-DL-glutamate epimerase-like enolase superfamily enzyme
MLVREPAIQKDGWIDIPMRPGIGVDVDRDILDRYRIC